jgi:hypothetical protein
MVRSPILAVAFGLVVIASIGVPGMAAFDARNSLVGLAIDGPLAMLVVLGTLAPLAYYGRLVSIGLGRPDGPPAPEVGWRPRAARIDLTQIGTWWRATWDANRGFTSALVAVLLGLAALATSGGAFGGPEAAAGLAPGGAVPITTSPPATPAPGSPEPASSAEPSFVPLPSN